VGAVIPSFFSFEGCLPLASEAVEKAVHVILGIETVDGDADAARVMHDMDVFFEQGVVDRLAVRVLKRNDA
jgi:hypothetical protein